MTTELYGETVTRLQKASASGVKLSHISIATSVTQRRLSSIANFGKSKSYTHKALLSDDECNAINAALDQVKAGF